MITNFFEWSFKCSRRYKSYRNVLIFSFFLNIFLNPLFIWGYGFVPAFGIGGLAIATVISQSIGTFYLAYKINSCKLRKYLYIRCFIPKLDMLRGIVFSSITNNVQHVIYRCWYI